MTGAVRAQCNALELDSGLSLQRRERQQRKREAVQLPSLAECEERDTNSHKMQQRPLLLEDAIRIHKTPATGSLERIATAHGTYVG